MASEFLGMFTSPEQYRASQDAAMQQQFAQRASLAPLQKASMLAQQTGYTLGQGIGGALGGVDPQLQKITQRQQIIGMIDPTNPDSYARAIQAALQVGDPEAAFLLRNAMMEAQQKMLMSRKTTAEATKAELSLSQEQNLRNELAKLPSDASEADILSIVTRYGSPDKVLTALQQSSDKRSQIESKKEIALQQIEAKKEADLQRAKDEKEREQIRAEAKLEAAKISADAKRDIGQLNIQIKRQKADTDAQISQNKPLAPSLQKDEGKDLELVDSLRARSESLLPAINSLTVDPKTQKPPLELGPLNNLRYLGQNAAGNSTVESRAYAQLQRAVQEATNLKTDAAKGVQTDKDVLRFANELIAAFGANDTKTSLEALNNFYKSTVKAEENTKRRIDSRRTSQGVQPYYGPTAGTAKNPIKLD